MKDVAGSTSTVRTASAVTPLLLVTVNRMLYSPGALGMLHSATPAKAKLAPHASTLLVSTPSTWSTAVAPLSQMVVTRLAPGAQAAYCWPAVM